VSLFKLISKHRAAASVRSMRAPISSSARAGFSLIEVLIALTITGTLLTATLAALDTSYKSYKLTTESASTNVVTRMVMARTMAMIRTGLEFGPFPADVLDPAQNPVQTNAIEFVALDDEVSQERRIVRVERRDAPAGSAAPFELWYVQTTFVAGVQTEVEERPLLTGVLEARFILEYDVGPRLIRATVDLSVLPNDFQDASFTTDLETPTIRLVSSVAPRRLEEAE
jgi:prepilin-type N-terminal cleavage/methylation domain-containing protein